MPKPPPGETGYLYAAHKHTEPRPTGTRRPMTDSRLLHHQPVRRMSTSWLRPLWTTQSYKPKYEATHYHLQVGTRSFEDISPLWPPSPSKARKLIFSMWSRTLSPRINTVSGHRGWIWLPKSVPNHMKPQITESIFRTIFFHRNWFSRTFLAGTTVVSALSVIKIPPMPASLHPLLLIAPFPIPIHVSWHAQRVLFSNQEDWKVDHRRV